MSPESSYRRLASVAGDKFSRTDVRVLQILADRRIIEIERVPIAACTATTRKNILRT